MRIAIDFDDTLTADAVLWRRFVESARTIGHEVVCVTSRRDTDENNEVIDAWLHDNQIRLPVYFTGLRSKVEYMESLELKVDIWIDDDPRKCALGH